MGVTMAKKRGLDKPRGIRFIPARWAELLEYAHVSGREPQEVVRRILAWFLSLPESEREEIIRAASEIDHDEAPK